MQFDFNKKSAEYSFLNKNTTDHALAGDVKKKSAQRDNLHMKNNSEFNNGHILGTLFHTCICYMAERDVPLKSTNCQRYQQMTTNYCSFTCTIID